eukprot:3862139-Pleurochrysis_carterae.AAC.3
MRLCNTVSSQSVHWSAKEARALKVSVYRAALTTVAPQGKLCVSTLICAVSKRMLKFQNSRR